MKNQKTTYTIGFAHEEIEMNIKILSRILSESTIHASFINETFFKLKDGQIIKMHNEDIQRYKVESRDFKIDNLFD